MDKRYQVFVSSTFADLKEERQACMQALLSLDHFPAGMELFPASDEDQMALIKGVIDDSDYYVLVIGGRYGSVSAEGVSYTESEFEYAVETKKPILAFIHEHPEDIAAKNTDQNDALRVKLNAFKKKVEKGRHIKYWKNPDDLKAKVIQSISAETKRNPREGWIRAGRATDPAVVEALRQEIDRLRGELGAATDSPPPGAQAYAGGDEEFEVAVTYSDASWKTNESSISLPWNRIFAEVAPILIDEGTESQMKRHLSSELWRYEYDKFKDLRSITITDDAFETIKVQLFALGLIRKSEKKHTLSDVNRYWSLTAYGQSVMMKHRAIPKNQGALHARQILE